MAHVKKCPLAIGKGLLTTKFYIEGKPQIYCYGWKDPMIDEPLSECKNCLDWVHGEQSEKDYEQAKADEN